MAVRPSLAEAAPRFSRAAPQPQEHRTHALPEQHMGVVQAQEPRISEQQQGYRTSAPPPLVEHRSTAPQEYPTGTLLAEQRRSTQLQEHRASASVQEQPVRAPGKERDLIWHRNGPDSWMTYSTVVLCDQTSQYISGMRHRALPGASRLQIPSCHVCERLWP